MANEIKLEAITFKVRQPKRNSKDSKLIPLDTIYSGGNILDFFKEFLSYLEKNIEDDQRLKRALRLKENSIKYASGKNYISGIFESGIYGYESDLFNLKTQKSRRKYNEDADMIPHYFIFCVPQNSTIGYILLQRFGIHGITTIFRSVFTRFFNKQFPDEILELDSFISTELAKAFADEGNIREIVLRKYNLGGDLADNFGIRQYAEDINSIELRIKAKRKHFFKGFNRFINDPNARLFEIKQLQEMGFDGSHTISVVSNLNGTQRTIDLSDSMQIRPYYDIDKDVKKLPSNHPEFESINEVALNLINEFINEKGQKAI